jgi:hypothetical protein
MSPETGVTISPATPGMSLYGGEHSPGGSRLPHSRPSFLKKNKSSLSLRNRAMSVSSPDGSDGSLATPMSTTSISRKIPNPMLPTPLPIESLQMGSIHIFKAEIHSPHTPGFPNPNISDGPLPLEPCPEPVLLRPFWLLRCIYQTIANPNGGYISNRLFVPREAWATKGVKLKSIEEKIAQLDLLTNALNKLGKVDSLDAEAVEKEMQHLEVVLDAVQIVLAKKLGHDVGVNATTSFIKDAPAENSASSSAAEANYLNSRSSSKSYLASWRKLRSKTSSSHLPTMKDAKDGNMKSEAGMVGAAPKLSSVPMTNMLSVPKLSKRKLDSKELEFKGPWAGYMASLARLCEAAQVVGEFSFPIGKTSADEM